MRSAYYPSSLDRVRYLIEAAEKLGIAPEADLFEAWGDSIPLKFADGAVIRLADAAVAKIYPALRAITFNILADHGITRSDEHTYELQSLMRTPYAVFCLKKQTERKTRQR